MENKLKVKLLEIGLVIGIYSEYLEKLFGRVPFRKKNYEPTAENIIEHVSEYCDDSVEFFVEKEEVVVPEPTLYDYLTEEEKYQLFIKTEEIQTLFRDKRFLWALCSDNHENLIKVIELLYYEGKINSDIFKGLIRFSSIKLTDEDIAYFKKIGLIPIQNGTGGNGTGLT